MSETDLPPYEVLMPLAPWEEPIVLASALVSLEIQTLQPDRLIVSCDGTPPPSLRAVLEQTSLPLTCVVGPGKEGVGPVLSRGLNHCKRELIVRADSDDISKRNRCAIQVAWMIDNPHVIVLGSYIDEFIDSSFCKAGKIISETDASNLVVSQRNVPTESDQIRRCSMLRNPLNHPSVILRRSHIMKLGSYYSKPGFEDYDLWLRIFSFYGESALANLPDSLVLARVGDNHLARRHGWKYLKSETKFFLACGCEKLIPWHRVIFALAVRLPLRVLPRKIFSRLMIKSTRRVEKKVQRMS